MPISLVTLKILIIFLIRITGKVRGGASSRKMDLALEVVCSIKNIFCLVKSNFLIRRLTVRFVVSVKNQSTTSWEHV
jgi:hypothetical protein